MSPSATPRAGSTTSCGPSGRPPRRAYRRLGLERFVLYYGLKVPCQSDVARRMVVDRVQPPAVSVAKAAVTLRGPTRPLPFSTVKMTCSEG